MPPDPTPDRTVGDPTFIIGQCSKCGRPWLAGHVCGEISARSQAALDDVVSASIAAAKRIFPEEPGEPFVVGHTRFQESMLAEGLIDMGDDPTPARTVDLHRRITDAIYQTPQGADWLATCEDAANKVIDLLNEDDFVASQTDARTVGENGVVIFLTPDLLDLLQHPEVEHNEQPYVAFPKDEARCLLDVEREARKSADREVGEELPDGRVVLSTPLSRAIQRLDAARKQGGSDGN